MPICPKCEDENPQLGARCPRDGFYYVYDEAYEAAQSDKRIGTIAADKYVIVGRISKGGMGAVYQAVQLPVEREVALKVLRAEMEGSSKSRDRFIREARAVSRLTHPNIITLYDFGFDEHDHPYMAMEYAPGEDMGRWIERDDLTLERVLHVTRQLLGALDAAHMQGIVHRDLKPENLIITHANRDPDFVKLLDFGIARMINETSSRGLTREGEVFGTPHYMAPEQAQGAKRVGPAADVYAVGIILYEMLTGEAPFDAPTPLAVLLMHINEPLPQIVARDGMRIPPGLLSVLEQATCKKPGERYQDAGQMLAALDGLIAQLGLHHTGAFLGVPRADLSGDFSRPALPTAPQPEPEPAALSDASPTISTGPPAMSNAPVTIHDPDPSHLLDSNMVTQGIEAAVRRDRARSEEFETAPASLTRSTYPKMFAALGVLLVLLLIAGGTIASLTRDSSLSPVDLEHDTALGARPSAPAEVAHKRPQAEEPSEPEPVVSAAPTEAPAEEADPSQEQQDKSSLSFEDLERPDGAKPAQDLATATPPESERVEREPKPKRPSKPKRPATQEIRAEKTPEAKSPSRWSDPPDKTEQESEEVPQEEPKKEAWGAPTLEQRNKRKRRDRWD